MTEERNNLPADICAGWVLLLPAPRPGTRVLCLELNGVRNGESLAYWHDQVTALCSGGGGEATLVEFAAGNPAPARSCAWRPGAPLPFEAGSFDLVVCRAVGGAGLPRGLSIPDLVDACARVTTASGTIYCDLPNPCSYQRIGAWLRGRRGDPERAAFRRALVRQLGRHGFGTARTYAFTIERGAIADILPARGYRPTRNSWRAAERLKTLLLSRRSAGLFAAAFGIVMQRGTAPASIGALLAAHAGHPADGAFFFDSCFVNPGKTFVRLGTSMFVVPANARVVARRRIEVNALAQLAASHLAISRLTPRVAREIELCGHPAFEFEAFDGATIDAPTRDLDQLIRQASELLRDFNRESAREIEVGEAEFAALAGRAVASAQEWYPSLAPGLERLHARLHAALIGQRLRVVWLHGDFKLENLIVAERDRRFTALIDWELSAPLGLPLCDLYYLLCYKRITTGAAGDIIDCVQAQLLADQWSDDERAMLSNYVAEFSVSPALRLLCSVVFVLHHVGLRYRYAPEDAVVTKMLPGILGELESRLAAAVHS